MAKRFKPQLIVAMAALFSVAACAPEVGSPQWCEDMKEKDKGDWTANQAADFATNCIF